MDIDLDNQKQSSPRVGAGVAVMLGGGACAALGALLSGIWLLSFPRRDGALAPPFGGTL